MPNRIVKLEEGLWRIRSDEGELASAEQNELKDYFDEIRLPHKRDRGRLCISGTVPWEAVYESLQHFYDGRADVCPF